MLQIGITEKYDLACLWSQNKKFKYRCSQGNVIYSFEALIAFATTILIIF